MDTQSTREFLEKLRAAGLITYSRCGSRETCNPPPTDTDEDWIILFTESALDSLLYNMAREGWDITAEYVGSNLVTTMRQDETNLLFTTDAQYYIIFCKARDICKALNLLDKDQRVLVHQILCED